jgi:hypothetical protein
VAPSWWHNKSLEEVTENRGKPFLGFERRMREVQGKAHPSTHLTTHLRSPCTYPHSPVGAGKSGVGGASEKKSSTQISVLLHRCWDRCFDRYRPVGYRASLLFSIRKNTLFGRWPALLSNKVSSLGSRLTDRPTRGRR